MFHKTVLTRTPCTLYAAPCPQIDRRKVKGRNERSKRGSPIDRANRSPAQPIAHLYSLSAKLNQSGRTYRCLASLRAPRISITDRLGGYRFLLILKNGPKPLHERSPAKESAKLLLPWNSLDALDGGPREECSKFPPASGSPAFADGCN